MNLSEQLAVYFGAVAASALSIGWVIEAVIFGGVAFMAYIESKKEVKN